MSTDEETTSASDRPASDEKTTLAAGADLADPHVGRTIGNYRIKSVIASGGMGTVYLADDTKHSRQVAVKFLSPELAAAIGEDRFLREIEIAARLTHPHILPLFDSGAVGGQLYYVMPYIAGESLRSLLKREKQLSLDEAIRLAREVASGISHAHDQGLVHRDIKPENVLLADGIALVADFGVARVLRGKDTDTAVTWAGTATGWAVGTPLYMAPEQAMGQHDVDERADLYALACMLYEMLAGQPPFTAPSLQALIARHMNDPVPPLASLRPGVPEGVVRVIERALAKSPADRYTSMTRFAEALALASAGRSMPTPAPELEGDAVPNNLPSERTHFIGRENELATCARLLGETRLLTLTGIGGCGKTRLALKLARSMLEAYPDGVWFVDLAPLGAATLVAQEVAKALGLNEESGADPVEGILERLKSACAMLILDNCEHLLDPCADLADRVLAEALDVRLLATSREGLGIEGERLFAVRSLSLPSEALEESLEAIGESEAVRLFIDRAASADPEFVLDESNAADVAEVCRRLDGIPLALELAAVRTRALSVSQIRAMLDDRFRLLTGGSRSSVERHRTLRATVQWSYDHLDADEQELFTALSVFAGGWTLHAAAALIKGDEFEVLDRLTRLIEKSLMLCERKSGTEARYRMLETLRQFGQDILAASGRSDALRTAHLKYFLGVIDGMQAELAEVYPVAAIARIKPDVDNFRLALTWGFQNDPSAAVRLTQKLIKLWYTPSYYAEGRRWFGEVLALGDALDPPTRSDAHFRSARLASLAGDYQDALEHFQATLKIVQTLGEPLKKLWLTNAVAIRHAYLGDYGAAERGFEKSRLLGQRLNDPLRTGRLENLQGLCRFLRGDFAAARKQFEVYLESRRSLGSQDEIQTALGNLSMVDIAEENAALAREHLRECLAINRELENLYGIAHFLPMLAAAFRLEGDRVTAARLVGAVSALLDQTEAGLEPMQRQMYQQLIADLREEMGEEAFSTNRREGRMLSWQQAIEMV